MDRIRLPLPAIAFAAGLCWIGWTAGHELTYTLLGLTHSAAAAEVHGYLPITRGAGALVMVLAFGLVLRMLFSSGSPAVWLRRGGRFGSPSQLAIAAIAPTVTFLVAENVERMFSAAPVSSATELFAVGVPVQIAIGLLTLLLARFTLRAAARVVALLQAEVSPASQHRNLRLRRPAQPFPRRDKPLAGRIAGRAPPSLSAA